MEKFEQCISSFYADITIVKGRYNGSLTTVLVPEVYSRSVCLGLEGTWLQLMCCVAYCQHPRFWKLEVGSWRVGSSEVRMERREDQEAGEVLVDIRTDLLRTGSLGYKEVTINERPEMEYNKGCNRSNSENGIQLKSARHIGMTIKRVILYREHNKKAEWKNGSETEEDPEVG